MLCVQKFRKPITIAHFVIVALLSLFSFSAGVALFVMSHTKFNLAPFSTLTITTCLLSYGIFMLFMGIFSLFGSYKQLKRVLYIYQIVCLIGFVLFGIIFSTLIFGSKPTKLDSDINCHTIQNYFEFKMQQISKQASSLYCTQNCPCQNEKGYQKVQDCPQWKQHQFQEIFGKMEESFGCSGWCQINSNSYYSFNDKNLELIIPEKQSQKTCYEAWNLWLHQQQILLYGCFGAQIVLLFLAVLFTNLRLLDIGEIEQ